MKFICIFSFCLTTIVLIYNVNSLETEPIVGGNKAIRGQFKYQVSIVRDKAFKCGGGIIGVRHIITAAHCFLTKKKQFKNDRWYVVPNTLNAISNREQSVEVEKIYIRKDYHELTVLEEPDNDIAVLKLKSGLDDRIDVLSLPSPHQTYNNATAVIAGYGYTDIQTRFDRKLKMVVEENGYTDFNLRYAQADVLSNQYCEKFHAEAVHKSYLCARVKQRDKNGEGVCSGDSGSPLVYNGNVVIGILIDSPIGCKEIHGDAPGTYSRVSHHLSFIENAVRDRKTEEMRVAVVQPKSFWKRKIVKEV